MKYKSLATATSIISLILGSAYLFAGSVMVSRWGIESSIGILLLTRRIGCLYLGLSLMFYLSRSAPISSSRTALCGGTSLALSLLAIFGIFEFITKHAGPGIFVSVLLEALIAIGFLLILIRDHKEKNN
jgi:hypothetical protein